MWAGDERTERREVHRIGGAQPLVIGIGIADEFRRQRVEERLATCRLNMLVHGEPQIGCRAKPIHIERTADLTARPAVHPKNHKLNTLLYRVILT
jgi:hypothetical protein